MTREKAIEVVKKNYPHVSFSGSQFESALRELVPELAESEDERMIKAILSAIRGGLDTEKFLEKHGTNYEEVEAYLEKQKDASKAIEVVDRIDKYIDEQVANAHDMKDSNPDKKYYQGWDDALGEMAGILQDVYSDEKQKEQKPDIEICPHSIKSKSYKENGCPIEGCDYGLEIALSILEKTLGEVQGYQTDDGIREHQTAIKAVKDVMKEQKPVEWKPSEEQMAALQCAIVFMEIRKASDYDISPLKSLYEHLKTLLK